MCADFVPTSEDTVGRARRAIARSRHLVPGSEAHEAHLPARPAHGSRPAARCRLRAGQRLGQHRRRRGLRRRRQQRRRVRHDYVELFNRGASTVPLDGWTLQYASGARTIVAGRRPSAARSRPGGHYLVQLASGGANGAALPAPDATGTSNLAVTGGKVAVVDDATALSCGSSAGAARPLRRRRTSSATAARPTSRAVAPRRRWSATTAIARAGGGCTDTDDNAADFTAAAPNPHNSSAAASACSATPPPGGTGGSPAVDVDVQPLLSISLDHPTLSFPAAVAGDDSERAPRTRHGHEQRSERVHARRPPHGLLAAGSAARHRTSAAAASQPCRSRRRRTCPWREPSAPSADGGDTVADERRVRLAAARRPGRATTRRR